MGAGSTKGVGAAPEDDNDVDRFSMVSQDSIEQASRIPKPPPMPAPLPAPKLVPKPPTRQAAVSKEINKPKPPTSAIPGLDDDDDDEDSQPTIPLPPPPPPPSETEKKEEKRRGLFGFSRWKDEDDKTSAFVHDEEEKAKKENSKGFKFFNWRKDGGKKSAEKDEHLDQEINDLQRTFDSLGIVGKSFWDDNKKKEEQSKSQSADDIRNLEPMRNRMNAKRKTITRSNGVSTRKGSDAVGTSTGENGQRRTFKYSWEIEQTSTQPANDEDQWSYKTVSIEGFDIEKFKKVNLQVRKRPFSHVPLSPTSSVKKLEKAERVKKDSVRSSGSGSRIPNSVGNDDSRTSAVSGTRSPLTYDTTEQKLLAAIERDFVL